MTVKKSFRPVTLAYTRISLLTVLAAFGVFGLFSVLHSHATTPAAAIETENGLVNTSALTVSDTLASGNAAVKFGSGATVSRTLNCIPTNTTRASTLANTTSHLCGFPDVTNTGPTGALTASGSITVTTNGAVIQNMNVSGQIYVKANNVTIKNTRVSSSDYAPISMTTAYTGLTIEDSEIVGLSNDVTGAYTAGAVGVTIIRSNIHGTCDGIDPGASTVIRDNYIHDLIYDPSAAHCHSDGIQDAFADPNITIQHNTIFNYQGDDVAILIGNSGNSPTPAYNIVIDSNLLDSATVYIVHPPDGSTGNRYTNNHLGRSYTGGPYYPVSSKPSSNSGNVYDNNGSSINL